MQANYVNSIFGVKGKSVIMGHKNVITVMSFPTPASELEPTHPLPPTTHAPLTPCCTNTAVYVFFKVHSLPVKTKSKSVLRF